MKPTALMACLALGWSCLYTVADSPHPAAVEHFEKRIRPILVEHCQSCHGAKTQRGGLRLDSRAAILAGGDTGPAVVPGHPEKSLLIKAVRHDGREMPPKKKLAPAAIEALTAWVRAGAPWPVGDASKPTVSAISQARKEHWSFRPVQRPALPLVKNAANALTPIDRFLLAKLEGKGLTFSPPADKRTLIRRATFDLLGLPPSPEEVDAFVNDASPDAWDKVIDRLLASPRYGERWGRHWLDVARYADTRGYVFTAERRFPYSYTYRDQVIRSFNSDLPYDQFILHQLAADLLPLGEDREPLAAMGFLTLGRRFLNNTHDIIDDRIDVVTRGLMALTVSCARCHDHKYDPIPTRDYYSLYGIFASSVEPADLPLLVRRDPKAGLTTFDKELQKRQAVVDRFLEKCQAELLSAFRARAAKYLLAATGPRQRDPRTEDLHPRLLEGWRKYLEEARKKHHPVLAPWLDFASLPRDDFAARGKALAARIAANRGSGKSINPLVAKAFAGLAPETLADVATLYEKLFKEAETAKVRSADLEAIRQVLHGRGSPVDIPVTRIKPYLDRAQSDKLTALERQVEQWKATGPGAPPRAMVLNDAPSPSNPRVLIRGNPNNPGISVPRQFLEVLSPEKRKPFRRGSGRLELARAIASRDNPLTARVMVNRVWQHHFGFGLVRTPGDFGKRGEPPSHPELLDWLADRFVADGWSIKNLHRLILRSAAYQQTSDDNPKPAAVDPDNQLLWRMNRRRLEFEPLRDSLLAVSGHLKEVLGGPPVDITKLPFPPRRSVYGFIDRQNLPGLFRTFDLASPDTATPQRHATTVPQQALFLMNSPFVIEQARAFAARPDVVSRKKEEDRIDRMHRLAYGRPADSDEIAVGLAFLRGAATGKSVLSPWGQYAQVLLLANELAFVD
jgi:mono/diheme cytochrome c family protein